MPGVCQAEDASFAQMKTILLLRSAAAASVTLSQSNLIILSGSLFFLLGLLVIICLAKGLQARKQTISKTDDSHLYRHLSKQYFDTKLPKFNPTKPLSLEMGIVEEERTLTFEDPEFHSLDRLVSKDFHVPPPPVVRPPSVIRPPSRSLPEFPGKKALTRKDTRNSSHCASCTALKEYL